MNYNEFQTFIDQASKDELAEALTRAHEIITDEQRFYISHCIEVSRNGEATSTPVLLQHVKTFEKRSRSGFFYREFDMGGDNYTWVPPHTEAWFFELGIWLDKACELALEQKPEVARAIFDICVPLVEDMDEEIVFAHEIGDWMISTHYNYKEIYENLK